jgi:acetyl-CoA carboxylase, biotin carboxylase subunit
LPALRKVLIANRGEIAIRIARACRELGIVPVAVYSEADRRSPHVLHADEAYAIGPAPARESYLRIDTVIAAARAAGADAVHPGYGFLAENADFARACAAAGIVFIGPPPDTIERMGEKTSARRAAIAAGVPVVPGTVEAVDDVAVLVREGARLGFPLLLKAAAGGGGKGIRRVDRASDLEAAAARARSEAQSAFGDGRLYLERALVGARHIEIQVLADSHGHAVHLFERECSLQRRHQKIVEESPSPAVSAALRERMGALAVALVHEVGYVNAGTLEFLLDSTGEPYFLEMNTRLQVEHPVTEAVTGVDLVKEQIRIAAGEALTFTQADLRQRGHAIECRVYAEDPARGFMPSPGRIRALRTPGGPGVRDDSGIYDGYEVPVHYDPLLSKLSVHADDRPAAIARMRRALAEYRVAGIATNLSFLDRLVAHPAFASGAFDIGFVEGPFATEPATDEGPWEAAVIAAAIAAYETRRAGSGLAPTAEAGSAWRRAGWDEHHRGRR